MRIHSLIREKIEKRQGTAARLLDRTPRIIQNALVNVLSYPYHYPDLDPFIKCMMAAQL